MPRFIYADVAFRAALPIRLRLSADDYDADFRRFSPPLLIAYAPLRVAAFIAKIRCHYCRCFRCCVTDAAAFAAFFFSRAFTRLPAAMPMLRCAIRCYY